RYSNDGSADVLEAPIFSNLGSWHLELGLSAVASTPNGDTLMAVGLRTDGSKEASSCALLYTYSFDGGRNWVYPNEIVGYMTNGGEGRMRPRVKFYRGRFYIFYNNITGGIAVTSIDLRNLVLVKTGTPVIMPETDSVFTYETISMQATNSDAIFYSFGDADPGIISTMYGGPFTIDSDRTIYARAYRSGYLPSNVVSVNKKVIITSTDWKDGLNNSSLDLYPVPASSILSVESVGDYTGEVILRVYNPTGQVVHLNQIHKSLHRLQYEIDVQEWPAGVYIMVMQNGPDAMTKRFVVK
ncbi:MAG: T9SS type A sorting domain-containing protein, partial [Bacteroidales bacterium]|nr:T9SS type A sorting domain-containing protein [Bacteroidales bacterium]